MTKITLDNIASGYASNDLLNSNFSAIVTAIENTLSRNGTSPNAMSADIDMNSNTIINLKDPINNNEAVTKGWVLNNASTSLSSGDDTFVTSDGGDTAVTLSDRFGQILTPYDFGAVGDGTTDDTTAMQEFFNSTAKNLFLAPGTFKVVDTPADGTPVLSSSVDDRKIYGPGIITATSAIVLLFQNTGDRADIQINVDGNNLIARAIESDGAVDYRIHHCLIRDLYRASGTVVAIKAAQEGVNGSFSIDNNIILNADSPNSLCRGINLSGDAAITKPCRVADNIILGITGDEGDSITVNNSDSGTIFDWNLDIINNVITTYTRRAIKLQVSGDRVGYNKISNTYTDVLDVPNIQCCIDMTLGSRHTIIGNELINNKFCAQIRANADTDVVDDVVIKGNIIKGVGSESNGNTLMFLDLNGSNLHVSDNTIFCPDFDDDVINISRVDYGAIVNNVIVVDEASGAVPFQESNSTNIVEFNNCHGANFKSISEALTIDYENGRVGINHKTPEAALDVLVNGESNRAIRLRNNDTTLSSGNIVHAIEFHQNDSNTPDAVNSAIRTYASGSNGYLELRLYTRNDDHRWTIETGGHIVPADDDAYDLGDSAAEVRRIYVGTAGIICSGNKVVGAQESAIADASGGATVDTEARAALNSLLAACRSHGLIGT